MRLVDTQRLGDKMKDAFSIDILAQAQAAIEQKLGLKLVPVEAPPGPVGETYEETKEPWYVRYWPILALAGIIVFVLGRR